MSAQNNTQKSRSAKAVLEVAAHDVMGAVRHVAACLARRAYPLVGMACLPGADGTGRLVLAVTDDGRLERLLAELTGLPEVAEARLGDPAGPELAAFMGAAVGA